MKKAGYTFLREELKLMVPPLGMDLAVGTELNDKIIVYGNNNLKVLAKTKKVGNSIVEHIETAIKYQGIRLSYLSPIFEVINVDQLTNYINEKPISEIRRCIWYLYEWLTDKKLELPDSKAPYTKLLDENYCFAVKNGIKNSRTRVINNLLGNKQFCPIVRKTQKLKKYAEKDLMEIAQHHLTALSSVIDTDTLGRSVSYLYTKETKSSTEIEQEDSRENKTKKFFRVLKSSGILPLDKNRLIFVQNQIVKSKNKDIDYRSHEIYVGTTRFVLGGMTEDIYYIGPKAEHVPSLMNGILSMHNALLEDNTLPPMIHAAIVSFGLVYIHPFSDGNGRTHRYLIHDILKSRSPKDQDFIIPVSAAILQRQRQYDQVLETISKPIMAMTDYDLNDDLKLVINNNLHYLYRYLDLTEHVEFLYEMMETAISVDLLDEIIFILKFDSIKNNINNKYDLPNQKLDLIVRLLLSNKGAISKRKRNSFVNWLSEQELNDIESIASDQTKVIEELKQKITRLKNQ